MKKSLWLPCNPEQLSWVEKFKDIFINQKISHINEIFNISKFGIHNSFNLKEYCDYEFAEFSLKAEKFSLNNDASIECFQLKDNFFYFSLGKKNDKAVFEAIFKWDNGLALGNNYKFKIEPKIQFIKHFNNTESILRRINIKPKDNINIKAVICSENADNFILNKITIDEHLGGNFYNLQYERTSENSLSYWDTLKIITDSGVINHPVLMRGIDHPLFISNLYPEIKKNIVSYNKNIFPVVLYILFEDGEEKYFKYPEKHMWQFNKPISKVCLTDNLSFDWIIEQKSF